MERTRGWSIPATVSGGGDLEQLGDTLDRGGLCDLGQSRDFEDLLETILRGFALIPLPRHDAEKVPALAFGHRFDAVPSLRRSGRRAGARSGLRCGGAGGVARRRGGTPAGPD